MISPLAKRDIALGLAMTAFLLVVAGSTCALIYMGLHLIRRVTG